MLAVERLGGAERLGPAGLEAEPAVAARLGFGEEVAENRLPGTPAAIVGCGAHRLELPPCIAERLERADRGQLLAVPRAVERDIRLAQPFDGHRVDAAGGRPAMHLGEV